MVFSVEKFFKAYKLGGTTRLSLLDNTEYINIIITIFMLVTQFKYWQEDLQVLAFFSIIIFVEENVFFHVFLLIKKYVVKMRWLCTVCMRYFKYGHSGLAQANFSL